MVDSISEGSSSGGSSGTSSGGSSGTSTGSSDPQNMNSAQSDWGLQLSQLLNQLGQFQFDWAHQQFDRGQQITDQSINNFLDLSRQGGGLAQNILQQYEGTFAPLMDKLVRDAESYNSEARQRFDMGAAESTVGQADEAARNEAERQLQSYGINPNSGRYQDLMLTSRIQDAAARAGAGTQAGLNTANIGRQMQLQAAQLGQNLPGMAVNALNSAYQGVTGAQNAELGMLNTGANLVNTAAPLFNASSSANRLPPVGNVSRQQSQNQSRNESQNQSANRSQNQSEKQNEDRPERQQAAPQQRQPSARYADGPGTTPGTGRQGTGEQVQGPVEQDGDQPAFYADPNMLWSRPTTTGPEDTDWETNQQQFGGQTNPNAIPNVDSWNAGYPIQPAPDVNTYQQNQNPNNEQYGPTNPFSPLDQFNGPMSNNNFDGGVLQNAGYNQQDFAAPQGGMQNNQWGNYFTEGYGDNFNNAVNNYQDQYGGQDTNYTDNNYDNYPQEQDNYYTQDDNGGYDQVSQNDYNDYTQNDSYDNGDNNYTQNDYSDYDTTNDYGNNNNYQDNTDYTNYDSGGDYSGGGDYYEPEAAGGGVIPNRTTGGPVPNNASPSRGRMTDDVPARLNAGEFVMPRDVVQHRGTGYFHNVIAKSRKERTGMAGPPARPTMRRALPQRPTFQSRQV